MSKINDIEQCPYCGHSQPVSSVLGFSFCHACDKRYPTFNKRISQLASIVVEGKMDATDVLKKVKRELARSAVIATNDNSSQASKNLGITRQTIMIWLDDPDWRKRNIDK